MSTSITEHSETLFTVTFNDTDDILTTVTSSGADVESWLDNILRIHRRRLRHLVVGLDAEWRPSFSRHQNPIALIQLSVGRICLLFHILHADYVPDALSDFLADDRFTFVGVGIREDADRLADEYDLQVGNTVDLRELAAERLGRVDMRQKGLAGIAMEVMGVSMRKPNRVRMSRWDQSFLNWEQVMYACVDAFLSFEIGRRLFFGEY